MKTHLWFDTDQRKVSGEVTHTLAMLRDDVTQIQFDSVDLKIAAVTLDGKDAKFSTTATALIVPLARSFPPRRTSRDLHPLRWPAKKGTILRPPR